jgi:signal transduction histidine kinase
LSTARERGGPSIERASPALEARALVPLQPLGESLRLQVGEQSWWIPWSSSAARACCQQLLGRWMIQPSNGSCAAPPIGGLLRQCQRDPALVTWSVLQWQLRGGLPTAAPPSPRSIAQWLRRHLLELLSDRRCASPAAKDHRSPDDLHQIQEWWCALREQLQLHPLNADQPLTPSWCGLGPWLAASGPAPSPEWVAGWPEWLRRSGSRAIGPLPTRIRSHDNEHQKSDTRRAAGVRVMTMAQRWPAVSLARRIRRDAQLERRFADRLREEKLAALAELAYGLSHEINNPLANIAARAAALNRRSDDQATRLSLQAIEAQAFRAHEMIADLMLFARPPRLSAEDSDLITLTRQVCAEFAAVEGPLESSRIQLRGPDSAVTAVDPVQYREAVRAVLQNAVEADRSDHPIRVEVRDQRDHRSRIRLVIRDHGPGLSAKAQRHAFDPYFSGREAGRGLGLGLCKVARILQAHGGRVAIQSRDIGCQVVMDWPAERSPKDPA